MHIFITFEGRVARSLLCLAPLNCKVVLLEQEFGFGTPIGVELEIRVKIGLAIGVMDQAIYTPLVFVSTMQYLKLPLGL